MGFYHFTDPDAPNPANPRLADYRQWLVVNIPGQDVAAGDTLASYAPPSPPHGVHRYVFNVFKQKNGKQSFEGVLEEGRPRRNVLEFAKKWDLGDAISGTFFKIQADD